MELLALSLKHMTGGSSNLSSTISLKFKKRVQYQDLFALFTFVKENPATRSTRGHITELEALTLIQQLFKL